MVTYPDITRIMNSDEIQSVVRAKKARPTRRIQKKNPLKNLRVMLALNPYAQTAKRLQALEREKMRADGARQAKIKAKRESKAATNKKVAKQNSAFVKSLLA